MEGKYFLIMLLQLSTLWLHNCYGEPLRGSSDGSMKGNKVIRVNAERELLYDRNYPPFVNRYNGYMYGKRDGLPSRSKGNNAFGTEKK